VEGIGLEGATAIEIETGVDSVDGDCIRRRARFEVGYCDKKGEF